MNSKITYSSAISPLYRVNDLLVSAVAINADGHIAALPFIKMTQSDDLYIGVPDGAHPDWYIGIWDGAHPGYAPQLFNTSSCGYVSSINSLDHVVGSYYGDSDISACLWKDGVPQLIALPAGAEMSGASDINDFDVVVGSYYAPGFKQIPFIWANNQTAELKTKDNLGGEANAINNHGDVVGHIKTSSFKSMAVVWHNGIEHDLGSSNENSYAYDINDSGIVVGAVESHATIWINDHLSYLDTSLIGNIEGAEASHINNKNQIVGSYLDSTMNSHYLYWAAPDAKAIDLTSLFSTRGEPCIKTLSGISETGLIAGIATFNEDAATYAFVIDANNLSQIQLQLQTAQQPDLPHSATIWGEGF